MCVVNQSIESYQQDETDSQFVKRPQLLRVEQEDLREQNRDQDGTLEPVIGSQWRTAQEHHSNHNQEVGQGRGDQQSQLNEPFV